MSYRQASPGNPQVPSETNEPSSSSPSPRKERGLAGEDCASPQAPRPEPVEGGRGPGGGVIRAVVFDIDGVLLDSHAANMAYYSAVLARYGYPAVPEAELAYGHSHTLRESIAYLTKADEATVSEVFEAVRDLAGYPYHLVRQPEGSKEALAALSRSYILGVMSSRIVEGIRQYLDLTGTHERFSTVVGYEDTSRHKPDAEPLLLACERLGVAPHASVYVGDAITDMTCAQAAGAHFIAFGDAIPDAEHVITRFDQLVATIERLSPPLRRRGGGWGEGSQ